MKTIHKANAYFLELEKLHYITGKNITVLLESKCTKLNRENSVKLSKIVHFLCQVENFINYPHKTDITGHV